MGEGGFCRNSQSKLKVIVKGFWVVTRYTRRSIVPQQQWSGTVLGSLFSGLSNCSVNTSPQNFVVNVNPPSVPYAPGVDSCLDGIDVVLVYAVCMTFVVAYFCCHCWSWAGISLISTKPHPGRYGYCSADLAVTVWYNCYCSVSAFDSMTSWATKCK